LLDIQPVQQVSKVVGVISGKPDLEVVRNFSAFIGLLEFWSFEQAQAG
jgi:hypothetical protein